MIVVDDDAARAEGRKTEERGEQSDVHGAFLGDRSTSGQAGPGFLGCLEQVALTLLRCQAACNGLALEARTVTFEPQRYHDTHRERLLAFIQRRVQKRGLRAVPSEVEVSVERPAPRASRMGRATGQAAEPVRGEVRQLMRGSLRLRPLAACEVRDDRKRVGVPAMTRARRKKGDSGSEK